LLVLILRSGLSAAGDLVRFYAGNSRNCSAFFAGGLLRFSGGRIAAVIISAQSAQRSEGNMSEHSSVTDPCGEYGPTQRWAIVWFFSVIALGLALIYTFRNTDAYMFHSNAEFFHYDTYRESRVAQASIGSDTVDERSRGDYVTAVSSLPR
jgi:hypothetical protein